MTKPTGLSSYNLIGFVTILDVDRAKTFYGGLLGLRLVSEDLPFALVYDANGIMLRLVLGKELLPASGTVLGWQVSGIASVVQSLATAGVHFERYGFFDQDQLGIWSAPNGDKVAWFKDPDGNTLSVSEHPEHP
jgi:catechol 2,3-dioxygenase-like lactoylglutathione lyase family enzyme